MEKKFLKWLIPLSLGAILLSSGTAIPTNTKEDTSSKIFSTSGVRVNASVNATINNPQLRNYLRSKFNKTSQQNFKSDDFLNSPLFAPTTIIDEETGDPIITIPTYQLDLSSTGIKDIRELAQFELPENIKGINLCGNGITAGDLEGITELINSHKGDTITLGDMQLTVATDFANIITAVNLNNNNIDLENLGSEYLNNEKLIFGVQNMPTIDSSGMVKKGEINPCFYIRENDTVFLTFTFTNDTSTGIGKTIIKKNEVISLSDLPYNDKYSFEVKCVPNSETAEFYGYYYKTEFTQFDIKFKEGFFVERKHILDLKLSPERKPTSDSPIIIDGFGDNSSITIRYSDQINTTELPSATTNITIEKDGKSRLTVVPFEIRDTIAPVIELIGSNHAYSSRNKDYDDPGVNAYDPTYATDKTGEPLTDRVVVDATELNVTVLGTYTIKYTVSDIAGNKSSITRIVEIQERVLDHINLRINSNKEISEGDDITLVVQPDSDIPIDCYKDITYYWYLDGKLIETTFGDTTTGMSTITLVADAKTMNEIYVKVTATQKSDNAKIEVFSSKLDLEISPSLRNDSTIIIALAIAVLIIIIVITVITLIRYKKSKGKTHGKRKNFHKIKGSKNGDNDDRYAGKPEIQVIRNYGINENNGSSGEGGGNENFRPPENDSMNK